MMDDESAIRELVDTWLDASKRGDLSSVLNLMTDDVIGADEVAKQRRHLARRFRCARGAMGRDPHQFVRPRAWTAHEQREDR